jgi:RNA polymerase sigma factor (sigma-70 family)
MYQEGGLARLQVMKVCETGALSAEGTRMEQPLDVEQLVRAARSGDAAAWDLLVERYLPLVTAVIRRLRLSAADADDVNQTVWLRLVEHLDALREPRALPGWLAATARNEGFRLLKRRARDLPVDPGGSTFDIAEDSDPGEALAQDLRSQALREAMLELPASRRQLLMLLLADPPPSYDEISARLGIPKGSIGPTRARILEQLRNSRALRTWASDEPESYGRWAR